MSRTSRWLIPQPQSPSTLAAPGLFLCAVLGLLITSQPARAQDTQYTVQLNSPRQSIDVQDENGRLRRGRFEANAQTAADGTARGVALLTQGNEKLEFRFARVTSLIVEGGVVRQLVLEGQGTKSSGNQTQRFDFVATMQPHPSSPDIIIYDIKDGFVTHDRDFSAQGRMQATPVP